MWLLVNSQKFLFQDIPVDECSTVVAYKKSVAVWWKVEICNFPKSPNLLLLQKELVLSHKIEHYNYISYCCKSNQRYLFVIWQNFSRNLYHSTRIKMGFFKFLRRRILGKIRNDNFLKTVANILSIDWPNIINTSQQFIQLIII